MNYAVSRGAGLLIRESQNTQSPGLRFRALLTEGAPEMELTLV
jgi:hypothetical protein